jgi:hypothetical protein
LCISETALFDSLDVFENGYALGVKSLASLGESEIKQRVA